MKKILSAAVLFLSTCSMLHAADPKVYKGSGEVLSADPAYGRITIRHKVIKGFAPADDSEFALSASTLIEKISSRDLVEFEVTDSSGDTRITKIEKVGEIEPPSKRFQVGEAVQGVLVATSEVAKGVTSPIPPVHDVISGATDGITNAKKDF